MRESAGREDHLDPIGARPRRGRMPAASDARAGGIEERPGRRVIRRRRGGGEDAQHRHDRRAGSACIGTVYSTPLSPNVHSTICQTIVGASPATAAHERPRTRSRGALAGFDRHVEEVAADGKAEITRERRAVGQTRAELGHGSEGFAGAIGDQRLEALAVETVHDGAQHLRRRRVHVHRRAGRQCREKRQDRRQPLRRHALDDADLRAARRGPVGREMGLALREVERVLGTRVADHGVFVDPVRQVGKRGRGRAALGEERGEACVLGRRGSREAERVDVEASLRVDDRAADLAILHRNRRQRERPRFAQMIDVRAAGVVVEYLPRPQHARHRERLRLHLVAAKLHRPAPTLLVGEYRRRDGGRQRRDQHREDDRGAAHPPHRSASHRSTTSPLASVSATRIARGIAGSPNAGQRSRQAPRASR